MYRTIDTKFWTDPAISRLSTEAKLLALYLVTNPHTHVGGIYYLPDVIVTSETGIPGPKLHELWDTLSIGYPAQDQVGFAKRDKILHVVWVVRMFRYQGKGEKNERSVANIIPSLHNSFLVKEFLEMYPRVKRFVGDTLSIGYPAQDHFGTQEQEQEQEQESPPPPKGGEGKKPKRKREYGTDEEEAAAIREQLERNKK